MKAPLTHLSRWVLIYYSSDGDYRAVKCIARYNSKSCICCMYHLSVSRIYGNMLYHSRTIIIENKVARLNVLPAYLHSRKRLVIGGSWQAVTEILIYRHYKARAVSSVCQACATVNIRVTNILKRKVCNIRSHA